MWFYYYLLTIPLFFSHAFHYHRQSTRVVRQSEFTSCSTPNNELGNCVAVRSCPNLYQLMMNSDKDPSVASFLRKSLCGKDQNKSPLVCCSISNSKDPPRISSTTPPVILLSASIHAPIKSEDDELESKRKLALNEYSKCGKSNKNMGKIRPGMNATLGDWPWIVAIGYRTISDRGPLFKCGGSLISDRWVITAAHCVHEIGNLIVKMARIGDLDLNDRNYDGASPMDIPVEEISIHPNYSSNSMVNDIALLRLRKHVTFNEHIRPICIPSESAHKHDAFYYNKSPSIAGWRRSPNEVQPSDILKEAQLFIVDKQTCEMKYKHVGRNSGIDHKVLCAGGMSKDACQVDSGGPLMMHISSHCHLIGIASYGVECSNTLIPGVYTKVAQHFDWIKLITKNRINFGL